MSDVDPNTDFTAALAGAAGVELPEGAEIAEPGDTSIAAGLTGLTEGQERDDQGRFAASEPAAQESEEESSAEGPAEGQPEAEEETVDPAVASWLEQHDGDERAALAALIKEREHAQGTIGRQGNELGELRGRLDQLTGYVEALGQRPEAPADLPFVTDETVEQLETLFEQRGARGMMETVIESRPDLIDTAVQVWAAEDPVAAAGYQARRSAFEVLGAQEEQYQAPQPDPVLDSLRQERVLSQTIDQARAGLGISDETWPAVRDQITAAFEDESTDSLIKDAVVSTDPAQQARGMQSLMRIAHSRAIEAATASATAQASAAAAQQAADRKRAATVVTGSLRPAGASTQGEPAEGTSEERKSAFKEALMKTEVTSVADGLTGIK